MLIFYGRKSGKIRKVKDYNHGCESCISTDVEVKVYRDYYHVFFVPLFPVGEKTAKITCKTCGQTLRIDKARKYYEDTSRTPLYFYVLPFLFVALIPLLVFANIRTQKQKAAFIDNPKVGDVYMIREDNDKAVSYYFLRVSSISRDSIYVFPNTLTYQGFTTKLNEDDYFLRDNTLLFLKGDLKKMLEEGVINSVDRDYDDYEGFNRIK